MPSDDARGSRTSRRITDDLIVDHERLHRLLVRANGSPVVDADAYAEFRRGLLRHIAIEEKLLFPAARRARGGAPLDRAGELRIEHAALTSLLVPTPDRALCGELESLIAAHDAKEEGPAGVYAECERSFSAEESEALAAMALSYPEVRVSPYYDGPRAHRTATSALAAARRTKPPREDADP